MPQPTRTPKPSTCIAALPDIKFTKKQVDSIVHHAIRSVAFKMGTTANKLPADVKTAIKTATTSALNVRAQAVIQRDVDAAVNDTILADVKPIDILDYCIKVAQDGISHIATDDKVAAVFDHTAKLLWKKFQALTTAGFSTDQAFDLILAEVQGRASRSK